ncbi:MAG: hypothetical protein CTY19_13075 [Methylomonas sp.]|nr:MAG: hypothetical protein CTY19_13075 [Methylomonas sp.]
MTHRKRHVNEFHSQAHLYGLFVAACIENLQTSNQRNFRPELNATVGRPNRDYLQLKYVTGHRRQLVETVIHPSRLLTFKI